MEDLGKQIMEKSEAEAEECLGQISFINLYTCISQSCWAAAFLEVQ